MSFDVNTVTKVKTEVRFLVYLINKRHQTYATCITFNPTSFECPGDGRNVLCTIRG